MSADIKVTTYQIYTSLPMESNRAASWEEWKANETRYTSSDEGLRTAIPSPENLTPGATSDGQPLKDTRDELRVEWRATATPPTRRFLTQPARDSSELDGGRERGREGKRKGEREGGGKRKGGREGEREGGRERGREREREGGREEGREGGRRRKEERVYHTVPREQNGANSPTFQ